MAQSTVNRLTTRINAQRFSGNAGARMMALRGEITRATASGRLTTREAATLNRRMTARFSGT